MEIQGRKIVRKVAATVAALLLLAYGLTVATPAVADQEGIGGKRSISAFTQNAYVGTDLALIMNLNPQDPEFFTNLLLAVADTYDEMLNSAPEERMAGLADRIAAAHPDLVALQEVYELRRQSPGDLLSGGGNPATEVVVDFLQSILDALDARGVHYAVAAVTTETDVEMPMLNRQTGGIDDARLTDREVILVRTDLPPGQLRVSNPQGGQFSNHLVIPSIGLSLRRGWCSVDVFVRGRTFRLINTHLEVETHPELQARQAQELLAGPASTSLPVIMAGDFNSDANHKDGTWTYDDLLEAGFSDPWNALHPGDLGLTSGHDALLKDADWPFKTRIDLVLSKGGSFVPKSETVLDDGLVGPAPPFWPSDHAGVAAIFWIE